MITIGYSTKKIDPEFREYIEKTCGLPNIEVIPFENPGTHSLTEAYNIILEKSSNDIVVLCHDDIYFEKNNWGNKVIKHFKRNSEYGIIGVAGSKYMPKTGMWWEVPSEMFGIVNHEHEGKKWTSKYSESQGNKLDDTVIVDGLFMVVNKPNLKTDFNEEVKGFHFYEVDFCFRNFLEGVKVGVFYDVRITHKSIGMTNEQWEQNRQQFAETYKDKLPVLLPTSFNKKVIKKNEPLISIVIATSDNIKRINSTLNSIFNQDYTNFEIIITNDNNDDSYGIRKLDTLKNHRDITIIHKEKNGISHSKNIAIEKSNGEYILPLSVGNMVLPSYIKTAVTIIKNNPNISPVYCDVFHIGKKQGLETKPEWTSERILNESFIHDNSIYSKDSYEKSMGYDLLLTDNEHHNLFKKMNSEGFMGKRIAKGLIVNFNY